MLTVARARPEIDFGDAIRTFEAFAIPSARFAADGTLVGTYKICKLFHILEKLGAPPHDEVEIAEGMA